MHPIADGPHLDEDTGEKINGGEANGVLGALVPVGHAGTGEKIVAGFTFNILAAHVSDGGAFEDGAKLTVGMTFRVRDGGANLDDSVPHPNRVLFGQRLDGFLDLGQPRELFELGAAGLFLFQSDLLALCHGSLF